MSVLLNFTSELICVVAAAVLFHHVCHSIPTKIEELKAEIAKINERLEEKSERERSEGMVEYEQATAEEAC